MEPKVSYVLPTYNRVEWVGECIQGLLGQTVKDIEVIVVDDASSDGTEDLLQWFADHDKRFKLIVNSTNQGAGISRNIGNLAATAPIIGVCDSDDFYPEERTELILKWFEENKESEVVNFPYVSAGYYNEVIQSFEGEAFNAKAFKENGAVSYFSHPTVAVRREIALAVPYRKDGDMTDDYMWVGDLIKAGYKIDFRPGEAVCGHRVLPDSIMAKKRGFRAEWVSKNG